MEEKDRMWAEYDRLRRWIHHLENMISGERVGRLSFETQELEKLEEMLKKGCQRLGQLRKRLGIAEIGLKSWKMVSHSSFRNNTGIIRYRSAP